MRGGRSPRIGKRVSKRRAGFYPRTSWILRRRLRWSRLDLCPNPMAAFGHPFEAGCSRLFLRTESL